MYQVFSILFPFILIRALQVEYENPDIKNEVWGLVKQMVQGCTASKQRG